MSRLRTQVKNRVGRPEQADVLTRRQRALQQQPETYEEFCYWIEEVCAPLIQGDLKFPREPVNPGHLPTIKWMYDLYCIGCGRLNDSSFRPMTDEEMDFALTEFVIHTCRAGTKTLGVSFVGWSLIYWNDDYLWLHTAASEYQAGRVQSYLERMCQSPEFKQSVLKPLKKRIEMANRSEVILVTGTISRLNSRHPNFLTFDEADLMDYASISEATQGLVSRRSREGITRPAITVCLSTQKEALLTMHLLLEECDSGKRKLLKSNLMDHIEFCKDYRTKKLPAHLECSQWDSILQEIHTLDNKSVKSEKDHFRMLQLGSDKHLLETNCALVKWCKGLAKNANGHLTIKDSISKSKDEEMFEAQQMCWKPVMSNAVIPKWDRSRNVSEDAIYRKGMNILGWLDYGFVQDPTVLLLACMNDPYVDIFHEFTLRGKSAGKQPPEFRRTLANLGIDFDEVVEWVPDPSAKELISEMRDDNFNVCPPSKRVRVSQRFDSLNKLVFDGGVVTLRVHPCCKYLIRTLESLQRDSAGNVARKQDDHPPDAASYGAVRIEQHNQAFSRIIHRGRAAGRTFR